MKTIICLAYFFLVCGSIAYVANEGAGKDQLKRPDFLPTVIRAQPVEASIRQYSIAILSETGEWVKVKVPSPDITEDGDVFTIHVRLTEVYDHWFFGLTQTTKEYDDKVAKQDLWGEYPLKLLALKNLQYLVPEWNPATGKVFYIPKFTEDIQYQWDMSKQWGRPMFKD